MTDPLDTEIRRLMGELSQRAPLPPAPEQLTRRRPPPARMAPQGRRLSLLVLVVAFVGVAVTLHVRDGDSSLRVATGTVPTSQPAVGQGAVPAEVALPDPTVLTVGTPPVGVRFIEGASRATGGRSDEIAMADANGRSVRLLWSAPRDCAAGTPRTTVRGAADAPVDSAPVALSPDDAPYLPSGDGGSLRWCLNGTLEVNLIVSRFDEVEARTLARTVQLTPGSADQLVIAVPSGFVAGRPNAEGRLSRLVFRPDEGSSSRPQLTVTSASAWTTDLRLLGARLGDSATQVDVGGKKGLLTEAPGGPRYQWLIVVYDDQTVVTLQGDGLTRDQLLAAGASLRPADPSIAPDVTTDPGRCDRLGLCG